MNKTPAYETLLPSSTKSTNSSSWDISTENLKSKLSYKGFLSVSKNRNNGPIDLYYEVYGTGNKKIIFIMGLHATHLMWSLQVDHFDLTQFQICVFDNRGIGNSSYVPGLLSTSAMALDALELLDFLNWNSGVSLIGLSLGGMIAQKMALKSPKVFSHLILTSTYHSSLSVVPTFKDIEIFLALISNNKKIDNKLIKTCFPKTYLNQQVETKEEQMKNETLIKIALNNMRENIPPQSLSAQISHLYSAMTHILSSHAIKKIKQSHIKTLVIHGTLDRVIPYRNGIILRKLLDCDLCLFEGSGHMINIERFIEYNDVITKFINNEFNLYNNSCRTKIFSKSSISVNTEKDQSLPLLATPSILKDYFSYFSPKKNNQGINRIEERNKSNNHKNKIF